ncbi:MAG: ClpXP protease specificity-enhancing factor SspB [Alphaproteobacteria bacterium]|nr:ClpXP protease specificity-enhancing factor SspB [Alphaproteobacteria bacterium]
MAKSMLRYDRLIEDALRGVVRQVLADAVEDGLPGAHHFYITFRTTHPGVEMSDRLRAQHPEDMTIVIQHQYWGLEVEESRFRVTLSFNRMQERLDIPFSAVTGFADPSVQFGLQFQPTEDAMPAVAPLTAPEKAAAPALVTEETSEKPDERGQVVALDAFRKK